VRTTLVVAIATAIVLLAPQGASAAPRTAYFKVGLVVSQDVTWTKHLTVRTSCGSGTIQLEGNGTSALRVRTPRPQPAVAQRLTNGRIALRFRAGGALLPVVGTISRQGESYATGLTPGTGSGCPPPEPPVASDCGTRRFPENTTVGVGYYTEEDWPYDSGPPPLGSAIALTGPSSPRWRGVVFEWCPGASGDDVLRGPVYEPEGPHSSPGLLAPKMLFGTLGRFRVSGHSSNRVDTAPKGGSISGSFPIRTTTNWSLTFTRLARRPAGL
jgi:hypothetical protein